MDADTTIPKRCSHGVGWDADCPACDAIWQEDKLRWVIADAAKAARFYEQSPGAVQAATIIDLYNTVARLAKLVGAAQPAKEAP